MCLYDLLRSDAGSTPVRLNFIASCTPPDHARKRAGLPEGTSGPVANADARINSTTNRLMSDPDSETDGHVRFELALRKLKQAEPNRTKLTDYMYFHSAAKCLYFRTE